MHLKLFLVAFLVFDPIICMGSDDSSQLAALRGDIDKLTINQREMQKNIQLIKDLLMGKQPSLEGVFIRTAGNPTLGDEHAKVVIVEFTDFECPFCVAYAHGTFSRIMAEYVKTGKVRYVSRNFPLSQSHPLAEKAAEAALCADGQGKYWEAHNRLFGSPQALAIADLHGHAVALGMDVGVFGQCLESGKSAAAVAKDIVDGKDAGVRGTPTFFIGYTDPGDPSRIQATTSLVGDVAFSQFQHAIDEILREREDKKAPR